MSEPVRLPGGRDVAGRLDRPDADIEKGGLTRPEADRARWDLLALQDGT